MFRNAESRLVAGRLGPSGFARDTSSGRLSDSARTKTSRKWSGLALKEAFLTFRRAVPKGIFLPTHGPERLTRAVPKTARAHEPPGLKSDRLHWLWPACSAIFVNRSAGG